MHLLAGKVTDLKPAQSLEVTEGVVLFSLCVMMVRDQLSSLDSFVWFPRSSRVLGEIFSFHFPSAGKLFFPCISY